MTPSKRGSWFLLKQVRTANENMQSSPTRGDVRKKLQAINQHALGLAGLLGDPDLMMLRDKLRGDDSSPARAVIKPERLRTMAEDADWLIEMVPGGGGRSNLMDCLGAPRGVLLIAVGVALLFECATGSWPSQHNQTAVQVCSLVAQASGICEEAQDDGDRWERHLKAAKALRRDPIPDDNDDVVGARLAIVGAWIEAGVWDAIQSKSAK
jgi:hypothetical protein